MLAHEGVDAGHCSQRHARQVAVREMRRTFKPESRKVISNVTLFD
jgi:hypothetical protein